MLALVSAAKQDILATLVIFHFYLNNSESRPTLNLSVLPESNTNISKENENDPGVEIKCKSRSTFGILSQLRLELCAQIVYPDTIYQIMDLRGMKTDSFHPPLSGVILGTVSGGLAETHQS